jgi:hypothetical protein
MRIEHNAEDRSTRRRDVSRLLNSFFRAAALIFCLLSFAFTVSGSGEVWIMWRDARPLAVTLVVLGLVMAAAAAFMARATIRSAAPVSGLSGVPPQGDNPYDVWHAMPPGARVRFALAVFPIFAAIGPIVGLMDHSTAPLHPLEGLLLTLASGGMAVSIILFGNRLAVLVLSFLACMAVSQNAKPITDFMTGVTAAPARTGAAESITFSPERWEDLASRRQLLGVAAIALLSCGYAFFVVLLVSEGRRRTRLETEMRIARRIQETLVPAAGLRVEWCDISGRTVPATEVGGDYFDYLELPDGRVAAVLADVAGHGVGAGILSAMTKSAFRSLVAADPSPVRLLGELNRALCQLVERNMFVTMAYMVIDPRTSTAQVATAGHPPVLHFRADDGVPAELRTPSMALGMIRATAFSGMTIAWAPGDVFLFYTDGVLEARDSDGGEYGGERLREAVRDAGARGESDVPGAVIASLRAFTSVRNFADDVTVVSVRLHNRAAGETDEHR